MHHDGTMIRARHGCALSLLSVSTLELPTPMLTRRRSSRTCGAVELDETGAVDRSIAGAGRLQRQQPA